MDPPGPSDDARAGKCSGSSIKRLRLELVDKIPENPKMLVFESTQQRYEIPLRVDGGSPSSHGTASASSPRNIHAVERTVDHAAQCKVDRVPGNLKRVVFESTQERFEHQIRRDHGIPYAAGHDSDDDDFVPGSLTWIGRSKDPSPRKPRQSRTRFSTEERTQANQMNSRASNHSSTINVRCIPADVIVTSAMMSNPQCSAIEADGFGHFLRMKVDAIDNKNLLCWLLDCTNPNSMQINIGPGKVLPITPWIISIVLGLPIGGQNLKNYSRKEGVMLRQCLIRDLNQNLTDDCTIHISNLQQEIVNGNVNSLMKKCFYMILCNRLLVPSSSKYFGSLDIKRTDDLEFFTTVDWSQLVFSDLQLAVRAWHGQDKKQLTQNINGCTLFLILYYIDNIDHYFSPVDQTSTPRISFYDNDLIHHLTEVDTMITMPGALSFGRQPFKRWETTCYATVDISAVPLEHKNVSMPSMPHCDIPHLKDLLSQPIDGLLGFCKERVQGLFDQFDDTLYLNTRSIEQSFGNIVRAQVKLAEQIRPFLPTLSSSHPQIDDTLSQQSLGQIVRGQANLADLYRPILHTLSSSQSRGNNDPTSTSSTIYAHMDNDTSHSIHRNPPTSPGKL